MGIGAQSGFALKVLFNDLLLKTGIKRSLYGTAIVETNRRLLDLMEMGEANVSKLHWLDPLPVDGRESAETDRFELDSEIVSRETVSTRRGYDWEVEQERMGKDEKPKAVGATFTPAFSSNLEGVEDE
jgi:hypothetical protein